MTSWTDQVKKLTGFAVNDDSPEVRAMVERGRKSLERMEAEQRAEAPFVAKALWARLPMLDCKTKTFATYAPRSPELEAIKRKLMSWKPADGFGLFLYGPPGTGKTHLVKAMLIQHAAPDCPCYFDSVANVMERLRSEMDTRQRHVMDELMGPELLALDDFGAEKSTDWAQERFLAVLEARLRTRRPVLMTSNMTAEEMKARYDARILDRLMELLVFVKVPGDSYRREIAKENLAKFNGRS